MRESQRIAILLRALAFPATVTSPLHSPFTDHVSSRDSAAFLLSIPKHPCHPRHPRFNFTRLRPKRATAWQATRQAAGRARARARRGFSTDVIRQLPDNPFNISCPVFSEGRKPPPGPRLWCCPRRERSRCNCREPLSPGWPIRRQRLALCRSLRWRLAECLSSCR